MKSLVRRIEALEKEMTPRSPTRSDRELIVAIEQGRERVYDRETLIGECIRRTVGRIPRVETLHICGGSGACSGSAKSHLDRKLGTT
jgi:hypothetical protein